MKKTLRRAALGLLACCMVLSTGVALNAETPLGSGTAFLVGGDLTDPENDGVADDALYDPPNNFSGFNATFFGTFGTGTQQNSEAGFNINATNNLLSGAFSVFDNKVETAAFGLPLTADPWPFIVGAKFDQAHPLTSFTLSMPFGINQSRHPGEWYIEGSNDTTDGINGTWTVIYDHSVKGGASDWANNFLPETNYQGLVLRYSPADGDDFKTSEAFSAFRLRVMDNYGSSALHIGELEFFSENINEAPAANAGADQSIRAGDTVALDGSGSFDDNTAAEDLDYSWSFTSKPGGSSAALLNESTAAPSFVADIAGHYEIELVVTDDGGLSASASVIISSNNLAPTAVATVSNTLAVVGDVVQLSGTDSSDPEDDVITYSWTITAAPAGSQAELVGENTATPMLIPDLEGNYTISLEVSDFIGPGFAPSTVEFTATTATGFAEILILGACDIVADLNPDQVTTKGNQNAFIKHLANAVKDLQEGETADAIDKLNKTIERTDGCPLRGSPDGNGKGRDWITDCEAQQDIYGLLTLAIETLE